MGFWNSLAKKFSRGKKTESKGFNNPMYEEASGEFANPMYDQDEANDYGAGAQLQQPIVGNSPKSDYDEEELYDGTDLEVEDAEELSEVHGRTPLRELKEVLELSQKGGRNPEKANSDEFNAVTQAINQINMMMDINKFGKEMPEDVKLLRDMEGLYTSLLTNCESYTKRHTVTKAGKARKAIVQRISNLAQLDIQGLHLASDQIGKSSKAERAALSWDDLLQKSRAVKIQMNTTFADADKATGGAVSDVKKLKAGNASIVDETGASQAISGLKFFKARDVIDPEENVNRVAFRKVIADHPNMKKEYQEILARSYYDPSAGVTVDPVTGEDPRAPFVNEFENYVRSYSSMKDELLAPAGLTSIGEIEMSGRNVATSRLADLLGIGNLIARSEFAEITDSAGATRQGIVMEAAKGKNFTDLHAKSQENNTVGHYADPSKNLVAPSFIRDITNLQVFDIICGQMDRHGDNMYYQTDDAGRLTGVTGIDNDAAFGLNDNAMSLQQGDNRSDRAVYDDDANLVIPHLDRNFAERVQALSESAVRFALHGLIGEKEILAAINRLNKLKEAIGNAVPGQLLDNEEQWDGTVQQEMLAASDNAEEISQLRAKHDVWQAVQERYNVANPLDIQDPEKQEEAMRYKEAVLQMGSTAINKAINHGSNYARMLGAL